MLVLDHFTKTVIDMTRL